MKLQNSAPTMVTFPWDDVPHFAPTWAEIEGKAQMYKTAYRRSDGKCVALCGTVSFAGGNQLSEPAFKVRDEFGIVLMQTQDLCGFVL